MADDPQTQLRHLLAGHLRGFICPHVPLNAGTAVGQPEACPDCLADRLMELFVHVGIRRPFPTFGNPDVDMRPHLVAHLAPTGDRDAFNAQVRDALQQLDGSTASTVALLTGMTRDEIDQLGGVATDGKDTTDG